MKTEEKELQRETMCPKTEQEWLEMRTKDITSTDVAALFGVSPYTTLFELWHRKKEGSVVGLAVNDRMKWGTRLQDSIAQGIAEDQGWEIRKMGEYIRLPELGMGSSFDFQLSLLTDTLDGRPALEKKGILEVKNVDGLAFRDGWIVDGENVEAPPHIELQVQHQLAVSGSEFAYIGALVGGNKVVLIRREPDPVVTASIYKEVKEFWRSLLLDKPPEPDFTKDAEFIAKLYGYAEPGKLFDARGNDMVNLLMGQYRAAQADEKTAGEKKDSIKAQILVMVGDSEKVLFDGGSISAGVIGECPINFIRKAYRSFKPSFKKAKE